MAIQKGHGSLLAAVCASLFCAPLMMAGVNAILPEMGASLGAGAIGLSLVGGVYSLGLAVFQLACGSMGDIWGHRRLFLAGAVIFCGAGAILGFLSSMPLFLLLRFAQGVGAAMLSASSLALLASAAPPDDRPSYLAHSGAAVYAGIACGPPVAGFIADTLGWRWLFWTSALAALGVFALMKFGVGHEWRPARDRAFDWRGCLLYGLAMAALTLAGALLAGRPSIAWTLMGAFAIFLALFAWRQKKASFPILNLGLLLGNRVFALSALAAFLNYSSFFGIIFYFSIYLQAGKGLGAASAGLILSIQALAQTAASPLGARLCKLWGAPATSALGAGLTGAGLLAASFLRIDSPLFILFCAQAALGMGASLFALANTAILLESAGQKNIGQASGITGAARTSGQLFSMIFITLTLGFFLGDAIISPQAMPGFMKSMRVDLVIFGLLNVLAIVLSLARAAKKT